MTPLDIPLTCSLTGQQKDALISSGKFSTKREGLPFTNDDPLADPREEAITAITARCYMFDLTKEQDRTDYADIIADIRGGVCKELLWEERVRTDNALVVYITVLEYAQITDKTLNTLEADNDKK